MSTSDQDQDQDRDRGQRKGRDRGAETPIAEAAGAGSPEGSNEHEAPDAPAVEGSEGVHGAEDTDTDADADADAEKRLTPRQARRLRIVLSSVGMVAMGVVLALRIASRSSVLVVGVYGLALILCGLMIELSRNGRTRLASWLLGLGLVAAVGADWLLLP